MKKTLLLVCAMLFSVAMFAERRDLPLTGTGEDTNYPLVNGWNSSYDQATKTITYTGSWSGRGWGFDGEDLSTYTQLIVNIEPSTEAFKLVLECTGYNYDDASTHYLQQEAQIAPGQRAGKIELNADIVWSVDQIYIQNGNDATTLTLVDAYLTDDPIELPDPSATLDFEGDEIGAIYPSVAWSAADISAIVEANPAGSGKALHVITKNWNAYPKFQVLFPEGKTIADIEKITLNVYLTDNGTDQNNWKNFDYFIGAKGATFTANQMTGSAENLIGEGEAVSTWLSKEFTLTVTDAALLALNEFDFGLGILFNEANYYLDNITFVGIGTGIVKVEPVVSQVNNVEGGIFVNANSEKVSVYGIDGRLVKQMIANNNTISLTQGVYIVKVGTAKPVKVLVK
jgi:hypothetical protein